MPEVRGEDQLRKRVLEFAQALVPKAVAETANSRSRHVRALCYGAHVDGLGIAEVGNKVARNGDIVAVALLVDY